MRTEQEVARSADGAAGPLRRLAVAANVVQAVTALLIAPSLAVAVATATRPQVPAIARVLESMAGILGAAALARSSGLDGVWRWRVLALLVLALAPVFVVLSATATLGATNAHLPPPLAGGTVAGRILFGLAVGGVLAAGVIALLGRRADLDD
jgi:hypothetical protein